jgi:phenol hydroxylase P4 protein
MQSKHTAKTRDALENFHGKQLLYVGWDHHTMICAPIALLLEPEAKFGDLVERILPNSAFAAHPDFAHIQWDHAQWLLADQPFSPALEKSLKEQGLSHKSFLRIRTPELTGIAGCGS